jgi:hypothetical protein
MLERLSLVIGLVQPHPSRPFRVIQDGDSGALLGHVLPAPPTNWLDWLGRRSAAVCETPDGSLLCVIQREWWWSEYRLFDSENQLIANIRRRVIVWPDQRLLASLEKTTAPDQWCFQNDQGIELAMLAHTGQQRRLTFHPRIGTEPFIKMALLAATLCD